MLTSPPSLAEFQNSALPFLKAQDFDEKVELLLLRGGANNRVYLVTDSKRKAVLKHYFTNPNDPRDRFHSERAFYEYLSAHTVCTPKPLAWHSGLRLGLLSFIEGRKLQPEEVNGSAVNQALKFIVELNKLRHSDKAAQIPIASEASFSVSAHLDSIQGRVGRLEIVKGDTEVEAQAIAFIRDELQPAWREVRDKILSTAGSHFTRVLAATERCLSPSDFGFHNALLSGNSELFFFDFEYAGWDDPAKLVCDFFCQPELPVAREYWREVVHAIGSEFPSDPTFAERATALLPAYEIKWCCIMLNDFVRSELARRQFAAGSAVDRRAIQLDKARRALSKLKG
jgi:hypothetical protein